jgi:anti-anti-sigma factor
MDIKSDLEITVSQEQARVLVTVFHLQGRLNMSNVDELIEKARQAYKDGMRYLLIDLKEVESISSAGLGAILTIYKMLTSKEEINVSEKTPVGESYKSSYLKLVNPSPAVYNVLDIAGFLDSIAIYDNIEDALASFG